MKAVIVFVFACLPQLALGAAISVAVDLTANVHPFSPQIFGVAFGDPAQNQAMGYTVDRWGGNSTTRYNWQVDVHNTARDYFWENIPDSTDRSQVPPPNNSADSFITAALYPGGQPLMTIPTIGWAPRSDSPTSHPYFAGFSVKKYGAQVPLPYTSYAVDPYDTDAGSGDCTPSSNSSANCVLYDAGNGWYHLVNNDPHDTSVEVDENFEKTWIAHMQSVFGTAANGGVKLFALDNEVMLWNSTHRDVHPLPPTYDEIWNKTVVYATAIKQQEPNALITGPVTWGYCDLFTAADDAARGNCLDGSDRQSHGGLPFVAWYLQQVCANPLAGGKPLVDYLDLHYYPQGNNVALSDADDATTAGLRLRSLKELYDPTWVSESWIGQYLGDADSNHYNKPDLIPRVRDWIDQYCPGTKLAITEYNWGNDATVSSAVAQAEVLAIFAREGVDLATRWVAPGVNTLAERGFSIFLNYDGNGGKVVGDSVGASSADIDRVGAYAFHGNGRSFVLLTNKDTVAHAVSVTFNASHSATWTLYGFTGTSALTQTGSGNIHGTSLTLAALPAISANLLVVPDNDEIFYNGFE
ncbi:MAG: glycoside hydrolase family 44 protein [Rudaea sp.]